jgi:Lon protease-like protein
MQADRPLRIDDLPRDLPVFAVSGAILLPKGTAPFMVFEPRYLAMVDDCLGLGRMFALVQPRDDKDRGGTVTGLYDTGCLARITAFGETGDGRYLITAAGICRFRLAGEVEGRAGYRRVRTDYIPYAADLDGSDTGPVDRRGLLTIVRAYLGGLGMSADIAQLEKADDADLTVRLAMACPFAPAEKQALLEAASHAERCRLMTTLIQRELLNESGGSSIH